MGGGVLVSPTPALAIGPLGTPESVTAVPGRRLIQVNWSPPTVPNGTVLRYRATASPGGAYCDANASGRSCSITGLTANTAYTVGVVACPNAAPDTTNCSMSGSAGPAVTPGPPDPPGKPTVAYHDVPTTMTVSWPTPSLSVVGAGIASYKVTPTPVTANLGGPCMSLVPGNTTSCDMTGLDAGTSYTFKVIANGTTSGVVSSGSSTASTASSPKIAGPPISPDKPAVARGDDDTQVVVSWTRPVGGPTITGYTVTAKTKGGAETADACTTEDPDDTSCTVMDLTAAETYTFTVRAIGEADGGGASAASSASDSIIPGLPGKPDAPSVELSPRAGEVTVYWQAPAEGGVPTEYEVTPDPLTDGLLPCIVAADVNHCDFTGLQDGRAYTFTVTARNDAGAQTSAVSAPVVSELPAKPAKPTVTLGDAPGKVLLKWAPATSGGTVTNYAVTAIPAGDGDLGTQALDCGADLSAPACEITGLTTGLAYTFTVTAIGDLGTTTSDASDSIVPDRPGVPGSVTVVLSSTPGTATVKWNTPISGGAVTSYKVVPESGDSGTLPSPNPCTVAADTTQCVFSGMQQDKHYAFTVTAINPAGQNAASKTNSILPGKPGAPSDVHVKIDGAGQVTVSWTPPGGAPVAEFQVTAASTALGAAVSAGCKVAGDKSSCPITDLSGDKPYTFAVTARNSLGDAATLPTRAIVANAVLAPTAVVALPGLTPGTASVSWTPATTGGSPDGFQVSIDSTDGGTLPDGPCDVDWQTYVCNFTNLDTDRHYKFVAKAMNDLGSVPATETLPMVPDKPGLPTGVKVALAQDKTGAVTVSWTAPNDRGAPTGYTVTASSPNDGKLPVPNPCKAAADVTSCEFTGLDLAKQYQFVVSALNPAGHSEANPTQAVVPDRPGAPTEVHAELGDADGSATVMWVEPVTGGAVAGYIVTATSPDGGQTPAECDAAPGATECGVTGMDADKQYTFTVRAWNKSGHTDGTTNHTLIPGPAPKPGSVQVETDQTNGTVTVTWVEAPGAVVDEYTVTPYVGDAAGETCTATPPDPNTCTFEGLDPETAYTFTVTAENSLGPNTSDHTPPVIPNRPGPPRSPTGEVTAADTVRVSWQEPDFGGPVATYTVTAYAQDAPPDAGLDSDGCNEVAELSCEFGGLDEKKSYTFRVVANGPAGAQSIPSWPTMVITTAGPGLPGAPTVVHHGANAVEISWDQPKEGGPILAYAVIADPPTATPQNCQKIPDAYCIFTGLVSGIPYTFRVIAHGTADREVTGPASEPVVPGPPDTPARPTAKANGTEGQVVVSWTAPDEGAGISGYRVQSVPGGFGCTAGAKDTSCTVSGLNSATGYRFRVQAQGADNSGDSAFSRSSDAVVPGAPGRPYNVDVSAGNRQIAVSWTAPDLGGDRIDHYLVKASPGDASCVTASAAQTECVITGLTNLTSYTVTVTAIGSGDLGNSPASEPSVRVRPTSGAPGSPTAVQAVAGDASAVISWTAPGSVGDGIARYTATASGGKTDQSCTTSNGTTCTITGLTNGQAYQVTVVSVGVSATGYSAPSAPATVTPQAPPGTPTNVKVTAGVKSLSVQWSAGDGGPASGYTATATGVGSPVVCTPVSGATTCNFTVTTAGVYSVTVVASGVLPGVKSSASTPVEATVLLAAAPSLSSSSMPSTTNLLTAPVNGATVKGGTTVTIKGSGYAAYTGIALALYSGSTTLAAKFDNVVTDSTGAFSATVTIPVSTGPRTIVAGGIQTGTTLRYQKAAITVS